jgi:hypothetical protein
LRNIDNYITGWRRKHKTKGPMSKELGGGERDRASEKKERRE